MKLQSGLRVLNLSSVSLIIHQLHQNQRGKAPELIPMIHHPVLMLHVSCLLSLILVLAMAVLEKFSVLK
jgi:hypothetical protein